MSTVHKSVRAIVVGAALLASSVFAGAGEVQASADSCRNSGVDCAIGDRGPRGGYVFYDAGSTQPWGRYLEAWPASVSVTNTWGAPTSVWRNPFGRAYDVLSVSDRQNLDRRNTMVGLGNYNTQLMRANGSGVAQDFDNFILRVQEPFGYWHIPSKDELDALYNAIAGHPAFETLRSNWKSVPHWTSSESEESFAWYQLFQDGTQFTDANGIIRGLKGNKDFLKSPVHAGSDFKATDFQVVGVRAIPATSKMQSDIDLTVRATTNNSQCSAGGAITVCKVRNIGPGGCIVFYYAGKDEY